MTTTEANKAIVRQFLERLNQGDIEKACAGHPGLHETRKRDPLMRAAFPDLETTIEHQIAEGDTVATRVTIRGTHLGSFMGVGPTGKAITWSALLMDRVVDGSITLHHANADWISLLIELGVISPPGQVRD